MNRIIIFILAALAAAGCGNRKAEQFTALPFPDIAVPGMIETPQDRAEYMAEHFWDALTAPERGFPCDSLLVSGVKRGEVEQKYANWLQILDMSRPDVAEKAVKRLYDRALACERHDSTSNVFEAFMGLADKYLHNVNSPLRNEEYYLHYASRLSGYEGLSPEEKDRYSYHVQMCSLNRIGTKAADFRFADRTGRMHTLYGIDAPLTLLFFSNPGCEACMNIINMLKAEPAVSQMVSDGSLAVLNIYIDEDIQAWRDYMPVYPQEWYNGFDPDMVIRMDNLYNVRAIPSLYLLDNEKRVILKDAPEDKVLSVLTGMRL